MDITNTYVTFVPMFENLSSDLLKVGDIYKTE